MSTLRERVGEVLREYDKHQDMKDAEALDRILSIMAPELREACGLLRELLDDWDELNGPRYHGGPGACDGPEGCRTRARAFLTRMKGVET